MRSKFLTSGAIIAGLALGAQGAMASAWTLPTGDVQAGMTYSYTDADRAFDDDSGRNIPVDFYKHQLEVLLEYGALDYLTVYVRPTFQWLDVDGTEEQGHAHTDLGLRLRVLEQGDHVFSLQGEVTLPGDIDSIPDVTLNQGETEAELRAMYGTTFNVGGIPAFFSAEGGYRYRDGDPADEWHADFALGWQPGRGAEVLFESLNVWGEGAGDDPVAFPYYRQHKVQGSLIMHATQDLSLQVGAFYTWDGQNVVAEEGAFAGGWYRF